MLWEALLFVPQSTSHQVLFGNSLVLAHFISLIVYWGGDSGLGDCTWPEMKGF